jgi:hypothetical protein
MHSLFSSQALIAKIWPSDVFNKADHGNNPTCPDFDNMVPP